MTNQRLWTDLTSDGSWMLSGGIDGVVRGWKTDVINGNTGPELKFLAHEGIFGFLSDFDLIVDCVSTTVMHPFWPILATCSGSHNYSVVEDEIERKEECSMKVWVWNDHISKP